MLFDPMAAAALELPTPSVCGGVRAGVTAFFAVQCAAMAVWLGAGGARAAAGPLSPICGGVMGSGAVAAGFVGLAMLPGSLLTLLLGVGLLGLAPFPMALVLARQARLAMGRGNGRGGGGSRTAAIVAGVIVALAVPVAVQLAVSRIAGKSLALVIAVGGAPSRDLDRLRSLPLRPFVDPRPLAAAWGDARDSGVRARLAAAHMAIAGWEPPARTEAASLPVAPDQRPR